MNLSEKKVEQLLHSVARTQTPRFDAARVRNQILDRIAIPTPVASSAGWFAGITNLAPALRFTAGIVGSLLVVISLTLGVAVTALNSAPGSSMYPLKKVVENLQLQLTPNDQKAVLQIKFANNRMDELEKVLEQKQEGKITDEEAQTIVANTVSDLRKTAAAAVTTQQNVAKSSTIVNKLNDISNKLKSASIQSEGQVKIELEKAIEETKITQEQAIKNLEQAGLKLENSPIAADNSIKASGKLTAVTVDSVSIGSVKFLITKDTKFTDTKLTDLKAGLQVDITGEIKDNKSYASEIKLIADTKTETPEPDTTEESQQE